MGYDPTINNSNVVPYNVPYVPIPHEILYPNGYSRELPPTFSALPPAPPAPSSKPITAKEVREELRKYYFQQRVDAQDSIANKWNGSAVLGILGGILAVAAIALPILGGVAAFGLGLAGLLILGGVAASALIGSCGYCCSASEEAYNLHHTIEPGIAFFMRNDPDIKPILKELYGDAAPNVYNSHLMDVQNAIARLDAINARH